MGRRNRWASSAAPVTIAKAIAHGSRARPVVALTFDDGYDPVALRQILAILKREKVTATFFPYGWAVSRDPADWKKVVAAGYPIGNHTLRHTILTGVSLAQVYDEMIRGRRTIDLYSGGTSGNFMRPPGGLYDKPIAEQIAKAGYSTIVLWDVDTGDWKGFSTATILARATRGTNGSIVLMHAGPLNTPKALPAIIANYRARGFHRSSRSRSCWESRRHREGRSAGARCVFRLVRFTPNARSAGAARFRSGLAGGSHA